MSDHFIAMIHKDPDSCYGVSFPDVPGVITAGDTLEEALEQAAEVLAFAFEDWPGGPPAPRSFEELRHDPDFLERSAGAILAVVAPIPTVTSGGVAPRLLSAPEHV